MTRILESNALVLASHNKGKLREIAALLTPLGITVTSAADHGLIEPKETETSFAGNARIKAHAAAQGTGCPAISDDSGIEVEALGGEPGVFTADWAETPNGRDFPMAMEKVWTKLDAVSAPEPRLARFVCVLCLAWPDGHDEVVEGEVRGRLTWPMRGELGFGFDPIFIPEGHDMTFGEMPPEQKHGISHRADAFAKLLAGPLFGRG